AHRALMPFLLLPQTGPEKFAEWEPDFKDILAYIESIPVPEFPFAVDEALAAEGEKTFNRACAECHGTYGPDGEYPELNIALEVVGTDPLRWQALTPIARMGHQWSWFGEYGKHKVNAKPEGYVAPPLDGIWATAPYLHNGSVPTLELVLDSSRRPTYWRRASYSSTDYDQQQLGWRWIEVDHGHAQAPASEPVHVYATTILAH